MNYSVEFNIEKFEFWQGAKNVVKIIKEKYGNLDELNDLILVVFDGQLPSETEINDFVWFDAIDMLNENENE